MATLGYVVPEGQQSKESFHAIRRTPEGLLYYTKIDKDNTDIIDPQGGSPTDFNGNAQYTSEQSYVDEVIELQSAPELFSGDGSTAAFDLTIPVLDGTRLVMFLNGIEQEYEKTWTYDSGAVTFKVPPFSGSQVSAAYVNKKYKNNTDDFYHQFRHEPGDATYYIDDDGYFVKRENRSRGATALDSDDFETFESTATVQSTSWQSAV